MESITHEDYSKITAIKHISLPCIEIGKQVRDGASFVPDENGTYIDGIRHGYILERVSEEDFKFKTVLVTGVPLVFVNE